MKKAYIGPQIEVEMFTPNTYVAACGDHGTVYKFQCNAGYQKNKWGGNATEGAVYQETNGKPGLQTRRGRGYGPDRELTSWPMSYYYACGETHEANARDGFLDGYFLPGNNTNNTQSVIIWRGAEGNNIHCTTDLDKTHWETAKS